jgi:hypothetical protein
MMVVCDTQNYWFVWLSIDQYSKEHSVSETGSVSVLRWGGWETPTLLGPLERANPNHWAMDKDWKPGSPK